MQQERAAQQIGQIDPLPASTRQYAAVNRRFHHLLHAVSGTQGGFEGIERGGLADAVHAHAKRVHICAQRGVAGKDNVQGIHKAGDGGGDLMRRQPAGHLYREGDQQYHVANHRRVKRVMAQPAVQLLGDDHRKHRSQYHHPPRGERGNADGQQQAGQQGGVIAQDASHFHFAQLQDRCFRCDGTGATQN